MTDEGEAVDGRAGSSRADLAVDIVFTGIVVVTLAVWFRLTRGTWFFLDEWALAGRGRTPSDFLEPYNGHLSVTYIAVYRLHMELFGFRAYTLLRVVGLVALASGPVLLYLTTRRWWGPMAAALGAVAVLWSEGASLEAGAMNHSAVVACTVVAGWAVRSEGRRSDAWLAGALTLGFLTAGGMVATAAGVAVAAALTRAQRRRWVALLVPTGLWAAWYLVQDRVAIPEEHQTGLGDALLLVPEGIFATLRGLAGGTAAGGVLLLAFVVWLAVGQARRHGRPAIVNLVSWSAASVVWWLGLAQSRQGLADPEIFRYRLVCSVFIVLSLVPPVPSPVTLPLGARRGWLGVAAPAMVVAAFTLVVATVNLDAVRDGARTLEAHGASARRLWTVVSADPPVTDLGDDRIDGLGFQTQPDLVELRDRYGPAGVPAEAVDRALVEGGGVRFAPAPAPDGVPCTPVDEVELEDGSVTVRAGEEPVELFARRYGEVPVLVTTLPAGSTRELAVVPLVADVPWALSFVGGDGACAFGP
jgi:hypothetical protein